MDNLIKEFKTRVTKRSGFYDCCFCKCVDTCRNLENRYHVAENRLTLAEMIVKLKNLNYQFTKKDIEAIFSALLFGKSKSYLLNGTSHFYSTIISLVFNNIVPTQTQMTDMISCYEACKSATKINIRCFDAIRILLGNGYNLLKRHRDKFISIGYTPTAINMNDIQAIDIENLLSSSNIDDSRDYIDTVIDNIKNDVLVGNGVCIYNIIKNLKDITSCCTDINYNCGECQIMNIWDNMILKLINKGCIITMDTLKLLLTRWKVDKSNKSHYIFDDMYFYKLVNYMTSINNNKLLLTSDLFDVAIENNLYNIAFYIADMHLGLTTNNLLKVYNNCTNGVIYLNSTDQIKKYCNYLYEKNYITENVINIINGEILENQFLHIDFEPNDWREHFVDSYCLDMQIVSENCKIKNIKYDRFCGFIHINDIIEKNNIIIPNVDYMIRAISIDDITFYNQLKSKNIVPNVECINAALATQTNNTIKLVKDILQYKIIPDAKGFDNLIGSIYFNEIFELIANYGFQLSTKMFNKTIKHHQIIKNIQRFNIPFDNKMYFNLHRHHCLNMDYIEQFDGNIQKLHKLREQFRDITLEKVKEIVANKGYIDMYCLVNCRNDLDVYKYLLDIGMEPVLSCFVSSEYKMRFFKEDKDGYGKLNYKAFKKIEKKMYGSTDNLVKIMDKPYFE